MSTVTIEAVSDIFEENYRASEIHCSFRALPQLLNNIHDPTEMLDEKSLLESSTCEHVAKQESTQAAIKARGGCSLVPFLLPQEIDLSPGCQRYRSRFCDISIDTIHDFDLSTSGGGNGPTGRSHRGTQPFMAMDLLKEAGRKGDIPHLYRHDLESFIWLLVWYSKPRKGTRGRPLDINCWATGTAENCGKDKNAFWTDCTKYTSDTQEKLLSLAIQLIIRMKTKVFKPMADAEEHAFVARLRSPEQLPPPFSEPSPYELFEALQEIVLAEYSFLSGLDSSVIERMKGKEGDKK
ncbi:hypothetical protein C8Q75DRAFT_869848 [Abortiporus biennis]|nr:hypothetical protein C8Q75DRAFT_869848 [Abortiporus biennis]